MFKRIALIGLVFILLYAGLIQLQRFQERKSRSAGRQDEQTEQPSHKAYYFSFTKYSPDGKKEMEIEGDSANILSKTVGLMNVVAKAYAQETPVTITADRGFYDKVQEKVHFTSNVVATTDDGARLLTEALDIIPEKRLMETEAQAQVKKGNIHIDGTGARGDSRLKKVLFKREVRVVIQDKEYGSPTPTVITSEGPLVIDYENYIARFRDHVVSKDQRGQLVADRMDVYYDKEARRVSKIVALGNVIIENPDGNKTFSDHVIYLADEGRVILGGDSEALYYSGEKADLLAFEEFG